MVYFVFLVVFNGLSCLIYYIVKKKFVILLKISVYFWLFLKVLYKIERFVKSNNLGFEKFIEEFGESVF